MIDEINRRRFMRASGTTVGLAAVPGMASARQSNFENNLDLNIESFIADGIQYTASVARNTETGERDGVILPSGVNGAVSASSKDVDLLSSETNGMLKISNDVLDNLDESAFKANSGGAFTTSSSSSDELWTHLSEASGVTAQSNGATIQEESILREAAQRISDGVDDSINRIGAYYIESPEGTGCDAPLADGPHCQLGAAVDYDQALQTYSTRIIGVAIGAIIGSIGGVGGSVVGAAVGYILGKGVDDLKQSTNLTLILRDKEKCFFGACKGEIDVFSSGYFMDEDYEIFHIPSPAPDTKHLHYGIDKVHTGYRDTRNV